MKRFEENYLCKSDLIRATCEAIPYASNKQIRDIIKQNHNVDVGSNLIISCVGTHKARKKLGAKAGLIDDAKEFLKKFTNDIDHAFYWLRRAAKAQ